LQVYALFSLCATKQGNVVEPFFICGGAPLAHEDLVWKSGEQQAEKQSRKPTQEVKQSRKKRKKPAPFQPP
jgi:hypothetical protein